MRQASDTLISVAPRLSSRHIQALDGLRGIAVILVFLHHCEFVIPASNGALVFVKETVKTGWVGVDLFFALSGFLITGILMDTKDASNYFRSFYGRRVLRIFPLYYAVLSSLLLIALLINSPKLYSALPPRRDWILYFTYLTNWIPLRQNQAMDDFLSYFWTLAVEEQFYVAWPFLVWLTPRKWMPLLATVIAACAIASRVYLAAIGAPHPVLAYSTFTRVDTLLFGALAAWVLRSDRWRESIRSVLAPVAILCLLGVLWIGYGLGEFRQPRALTHSVTFTLLAIGFSALILLTALPSASARDRWPLLSSGILTRTGKYSYGIYIFHVPVIFAATILWKRITSGNLLSGLAFILVTWLVTYAIAWISYTFFESRFLKLKVFFEPAPAEPH